MKKVTDFVGAVYPAARGNYEKGGVNPVFATAQAALETGWNADKPGNNLFGITVGRSWTGRRELVQTTEFFATATKQFTAPERVLKIEKAGSRYRYTVMRYFRAYSSIAECLEDHLALLKKPLYADAWAFRENPREYARRIVDGHGARYATDPDYASKMGIVIGMVEKTVKELGL